MVWRGNTSTLDMFKYYYFLIVDMIPPFFRFFLWSFVPAGVNEWRGASHSSQWSPAPLPLPRWHRECQAALRWLVSNRVRAIYFSVLLLDRPSIWTSVPNVSDVWPQVPRLMVSRHNVQQEVLLPRCHLQRRHRGNDCGRNQKPDQSTQRGT